MAKTKISEFSATPGNNTDIDGINIAEGCAPSGINDAIRELMAQLKDFQAGTAGDSFNGPVGTTTAAAGAFTTLTTSGAVTHNGGTANGVAYLNGSKVLTTGSALTFDGTNLLTSGSINAGLGKFLAFSASAASASNYSIYGDASTTVLNGPYAGVIQFNLANSEQMRLTSTGLGIGTSSPGAKLQAVVGSAGAGTLGQISIGYAGGSLNYYDANTHIFRNGSATEGMRLDSSGNLGLGVTPSAWATSKAVQIGNRASLFSYNNSTTDVGNNAYYNGSDYKYIETATATFYRQGSGAHSWYTAPSGTAGNAISFTQAMTLDASGNLQLGGTTGGARLNVLVPTTGLIANFTNTTNADFQINAVSGLVTVGSSTSTPIAFATGGTERARIDSSGNLLVGKTSTDEAIQGIAARGSSGLLVVTRDGGDPLSLRRTSNDGAIASFRRDATLVGTISVTTSATAYNTSSDYRLKENIAPMTGALAKVAQLKPCTYNWKADGSDGEGFIAHELAEVVPQCVTGEKDSVDAEGKPVYQGIDTSFLVATLTAAIQEQQAIINQLKARLDAANL